MIAVDTNILVYAHRRESALGGAARERIGELAASRAPWGLPWSVVHEFIALVTRRRPEVEPTPTSLAIAAVERLTDSPGCVLLAEAPDHLVRFRALAEAAQLSGVRLYDARIAAVCLGHGVRELWTADRDFALFPGLKARNPLVA